MENFHAADHAFTAVAWFMAVALSASVLTLAASPLLKRLTRRQEQRQEAEELRRTDGEYQRQLQDATDNVITDAVRAHLAEPVTEHDLVRPQPLFVTITDVIVRARTDHALRVPRRDAAAMLRHRLEYRGHAHWPDVITDAYETERD